MTNPIPLNEQIADHLRQSQEPREYAQPAVDALAEQSKALEQDIAILRGSVNQQVKDIKDFDHDTAKRREEMVERLEADRAEVARMVEAQAGVRKSLADLGTLLKATSPAPKRSVPKRRSRAKGKVREAAE